MAQNRGKDVYRKGEDLEVVLPKRGKNDLLGERRRFPGEPRASGKLCRLTIKETSSKTDFKDFPSTLRAPPTNCFWKSIMVCKVCLHKFSWRIRHFLKNQGVIWKTIIAYNASKNVDLRQVFLCRFLRTVAKTFRSFSKFF